MPRNTTPPGTGNLPHAAEGAGSAGGHRGRLRLPRFESRGAFGRDRGSGLVLFPRVAGYMQDRYANRGIHYLGNVVNNLRDVAESEALERKRRSFEILFVGGSRYIEGALRLIETYRSLKPARPQLSLNIVGMKESEFADLPAGVRCHAYLDKADAGECERYYALLENARVIVNTTPKWGALFPNCCAPDCSASSIIRPTRRCAAGSGTGVSSLGAWRFG